MAENLSASAQKVQDALSAHGVQFKVIELPDSTRTAQEAATTIGCTVEQIIKSLVFRTQQTEVPILVLASGINRVNEKAVSEVLGEPVEKASADFVRKVTGFVIGGVPPVGHSTSIITYIDQDLLKHEELWAAAGTPNAVFNLNATDLKQLTNGIAISIK